MQFRLNLTELQERVGLIVHLKNFFFRPLAAILNFAQKCKQTAISQKLSMVKKFFFFIFLHPIRCLNFWDNKIFWGARTGPLTHASSVKYHKPNYRLGEKCFPGNFYNSLGLTQEGYKSCLGNIFHPGDSYDHWPLSGEPFNMALNCLRESAKIIIN